MPQTAEPRLAEPTPEPSPATELLTLAMKLAGTGHSVIPVGIDKQPVDRLRWKPFQSVPATSEQICQWAEHPRTTGFALVTGQVSHGAEALDFDQPGFLEALTQAEPELVDRLALQRTGSGGIHLLYRRARPAGNQKLAWAPESGAQDGRVIAVETRGEGGYLLIAHSLHASGRRYELLRGDWLDLPLLSEEEVMRLHQAARRLCLAPLTPGQVQRLAEAMGRRRKGYTGVIDAYNAQTPLETVLEQAGYMAGGQGRYIRPDGLSGSVVLLDGPDGRRLSYHHSSNDPLADGRPHDGFDVFTAYVHSGDVPAAVRAAAEELGLAPPRSASPSPADSGQVYVQPDGYYVDRPRRERGQVVAWVPERLTNFVWEPRVRLLHPDGTSEERGLLTVDGVGQHEMQIAAHAWGNRRDLLAAVGGRHGLCFTTNNADIARIAQANLQQFRELPAARGVRSYGLHQVGEEWLELFEDRSVSLQEPPPLFYSGTPVDPGSPAFLAPGDASPAQVQLARQALERIPGMVTPATAYALLGYGVAAAFAPRITPHLGNRLPFLFLAGERESGKTSAAQLVLELVNGNGSRITKTGGMSLYQYDIAHSGANNLLSILDEYRPGEIDDAQLRRHHDLGVKWRGSGVASKDHAYVLNSPTIVAGEGFSDDAATRSRGVLFYTRKEHRGRLEDYSDLTRQPLWAYAGHLHALARNTTEDVHLARLDRAGNLSLEATRQGANPRLQYALTFLAYGLLVLQADVSGAAFADDQILACVRDGAGNSLEGGTESITNLELFLEQLGTALAQVGDRELYIVPAATPGHLIIRPRPCLDLVQQRFRERAAIANVALLRQYADRADFFEGGDTHKSVGTARSVRGCRLVLAGIPERCEADLLRTYDAALRRLYGG